VTEGYTRLDCIERIGGEDKKERFEWGVFPTILYAERKILNREGRNPPRGFC